MRTRFVDPLHPGIGLLLVLLLSGCDKGVRTYPVSGRVLFPDGEPMTSGLVQFKSVTESGFSARGPIAADGSFHMMTFKEKDGAIAGDHLVAIIPPIRPNTDGGPLLQDTIDPKFKSFRDSGLTVTVSDQDPQQNHFTLQVGRPTR